MKTMPSPQNKLLLPFLIILLGMLTISGCAREEPMQELQEITYIIESGPILPEMQLREIYTITRQSVTLNRNGAVDATMVNQGTWQVEPEAQALTAIFETLTGVDLKSIQKVEPEDIPEGGGSEYFTLTFSDGKTFLMEYTPGVTYRNGSLITQPVKEFLKQLELPAEAAAQLLVQ